MAPYNALNERQLRSILMTIPENAHCVIDLSNSRLCVTKKLLGSVPIFVLVPI